MYRTFHNYTNFLHNMSTLSFLLKLFQFGKASYTYKCLTLFDLRKITLMIKDISELVRGETLWKSSSTRSDHVRLGTEGMPF